MSHRAESGLRLFGDAGEHHGDMIAGVPISCAGNDDARAMDLAVITRD